MASRDGDSIFAQFSSLAKFGTSQMAKAQELARKHNAVTEVSPHGLFLSSRSSAANPEVLHANGITHVLSVCGRYEPVDASLAYRFHSLPGKGAVKLEVIVDCLQFIEDALHGDEKGTGTPNRVLLHCTFGQSRSAAIAVGYLARHPLSRALVGVDAAHTCLSAARDCVDIHPDLLAATRSAVAATRGTTATEAAKEVAATAAARAVRQRGSQGARTLLAMRASCASLVRGWGANGSRGLQSQRPPTQRSGRSSEDRRRSALRLALARCTRRLTDGCGSGAHYLSGACVHRSAVGRMSVLFHFRGNCARITAPGCL